MGGIGNATRSRQDCSIQWQCRIDPGSSAAAGQTCLQDHLRYLRSDDDDVKASQAALGVCSLLEEQGYWGAKGWRPGYLFHYNWSAGPILVNSSI